MKALISSEPRALTATETLLLTYCDSERQAIALAPYVHLNADATQPEIEHAVLCALVHAKEAVSGCASVEFISGQRRDTLRDALRLR